MLATLTLEVYYRYLRLYDEPNIPPAMAPVRPRGGDRDPAVGRRAFSVPRLRQACLRRFLDQRRVRCADRVSVAKGPHSGPYRGRIQGFWRL